MPLAVFWYMFCVAAMAVAGVVAAATSRLRSQRARALTVGLLFVVMLAGAGWLHWRVVDGLDQATRAKAARVIAPAEDRGLPPARWLRETAVTSVWPVVAGQVELIVTRASWHGISARDRYLRERGRLVRCDTVAICLRIAQEASARATTPARSG